MIVVITSIELKSPFKFFALMLISMKIMRQLKDTPCMAQQASGFWMKHYTMTLWNSVEEMKNFARSGDHLRAMKLSSTFAKEIRTLTLEASSLPEWKPAKQRLLREGKVLNF